MEYDLDRLSITTGISPSHLKDDLNTYSVMSFLFPKLEAKDQTFGLYGGTALNKIYFGKNQRLSYDIDLLCYDYKKIFQALKDFKAVLISSSQRIERAKFNLNGVEIDLWGIKKETAIETPEKRELVDLLHYFGYLVPSILAPSYSIEYLIAEKTIALADRNMLKDIYDTWRGLKLLEDKNKYKKYINKISERDDISGFPYVLSQLEFMAKNINYYKKETIDLIYQPDIELMLNEIKSYIERI
jgi:predicted nucleotidyltransferase component of viral defense system